MALGSLDIANRAISIIGGSAITSFDGQSAEAKILKQLYEPAVEAELSHHNWKFSKKYERLSRSDSQPLVKYSAAYYVPSDALRLITIYVGSSVASYEVSNGYIFTDASDSDDVVCEYIYRAPEVNWSPDFTQGFVHKLASMLGSAIPQNRSLAELHYQMYQTSMARARTVDSQSQTAQKLVTGGLVRRRYN